MIYSSSGVYALREMGTKLIFSTGICFFFAGLLLMFGVMAIDYRELRPWAEAVHYLRGDPSGLVLIRGSGKPAYGARRWFKLGVLSFQPSEFAKLAMLVYMADFLARKQTKGGPVLEWIFAADHGPGCHVPAHY